MTTTTTTNGSPHSRGAMDACISACTDCHRICAATVQYCLAAGGKHAAPDHIRLLIDCAEICQTSANFLGRDSPLHKETCRTCAKICEQCAADCDAFAGDAQMKACAEACRRCAQTCRDMAKA